MKIELKDERNAIIGWLDDQGSYVYARHLTKGQVGYYNKMSNITFRQNGSIYCYGDGAQCLVRIAQGEIK